MPRDDDHNLTALARVMRTHKRPSKTVTFPVLNVKVAIVVPTDEEIAEADAAATQFLTSKLKLNEYQVALAMERNLYEAEQQRQLLARALRDPSDTDVSFGTVDELREILNPDIRKILLRHLGAWMDEQDPEPKPSNDPDELTRLISDLKDAGALSEYLTCCGTDTLRSIALSLAAALPTPPRPSSTDTSSSNSPSPSTSDPT